MSSRHGVASGGPIRQPGPRRGAESSARHRWIAWLGALTLVWSGLLAGLPAQLSPLREPQTAGPPELQLLVVPLTGVLGTQEIALCHRALREAAARHLGVVFRLDDAGGDAESAADVQGLLDHLEQVRATVATTAVVHGHVRGGAAYLALLCDQLYFLRDGDIGSITPMPTFFDQLEELSDESAERKRLRAYADELRQRLERRRTPPSSDALRLCEGMADPAMQLVRVRLRERGMETSRIVEASELTGLQAAGATILEQTKVTQPVVLTAAEADEVRLSQGVVQTMEQLCTDVLRVDPSTVGELEFAWSERMVGWLEWFQPALLVLGLVLLILEVKTPGVGLPGLLGTAFLALALFYNYLVGLAELTEILLFFLGIAALAVEIFLLPGLIVFGAVGFLSLVFSLILSRQTFVLPSTVSQHDILFHNLVHLTVLFVAVLVFASLLWRVLPKVPLLNRLYLPAPSPTFGGTAVAPSSAPERFAALVGAVGRASTVLRPAGVMVASGERYDVVTNGEFIDSGALVRVLEVRGNRILVERADAGGAGGAEGGSVGLVLLLALVGLLLLVGEVFFVSFGVLTLLSGAALFGSVFLAFQDGNGFGMTMLVAEAVLAPLVLWGAFRILPRTPFGRALMLEGPRHEEVAGGAMDPALRDLPGKHGVTVSRLRPAGFARIDGRKVDVVTRGELLEQGSPIRVIEVVGNRVVVKLDEQPGAAAASNESQGVME
ncbi:MAG: NfeD family protein [Planctomycetota bacterium]